MERRRRAALAAAAAGGAQVGAPLRQQLRQRLQPHALFALAFGGEEGGGGGGEIALTLERRRQQLVCERRRPRAAHRLRRQQPEEQRARGGGVGAAAVAARVARARENRDTEPLGQGVARRNLQHGGRRRPARLDRPSEQPAQHSEARLLRRRPPLPQHADTAASEREKQRLGGVGNEVGGRAEGGGHAVGAAAARRQLGSPAAELAERSYEVALAGQPEAPAAPFSRRRPPTHRAAASPRRPPPPAPSSREVPTSAARCRPPPPPPPPARRRRHRRRRARAQQPNRRAEHLVGGGRLSRTGLSAVGVLLIRQRRER